jgi:tRNA(Ser,Leu) C12 N-acetylase TAN1
VVRNEVSGVGYLKVFYQCWAIAKSKVQSGEGLGKRRAGIKYTVEDAEVVLLCALEERETVGVSFGLAVPGRVVSVEVSDDQSGKTFACTI